MNILLDSKLRIREVISDEQFIETCITRIEKYHYTHTDTGNDYEDYEDNNDIDNEDNNNIELDF
jgi:hypothetical protein